MATSKSISLRLRPVPRITAPIRCFQPTDKLPLARQQSPQSRPPQTGLRLPLATWLCRFVACAVWIVVLALLGSGELQAGEAPVKRAEARVIASRAALLADPFNLELSWKLAEACFDRGEFATNNTERATLAEEGIQAAREVVRRKSGLVAGHFFLAMNLGQLARTRTLSALGLVSEMEQQFLAAIAIDPGFQNAGPERSLGMLYLEAPGWPTSIGSRSKARTHLQKAVELAPEFPENQLVLLEAEWKWGEKKKVAAKMPELEKVFTAAQGKLKGEDWEESWRDWNERIEHLRKQVSASSVGRRTPKP